MSWSNTFDWKNSGWTELNPIVLFQAMELMENNNWLWQWNWTEFSMRAFYLPIQTHPVRRTPQRQRKPIQIAVTIQSMNGKRTELLGHYYHRNCQNLREVGEGRRRKNIWCGTVYLNIFFTRSSTTISMFLVSYELYGRRLFFRFHHLLECTHRPTKSSLISESPYTKFSHHSERLRLFLVCWLFQETRDWTNAYTRMTCLPSVNG